MGICYYIQREDARVLDCSKWFPKECVDGVGGYNDFAWAKIPYATADEWIDAIRNDAFDIFDTEPSDNVEEWCRIVHAWATGKYIRWADDNDWYEFCYNVSLAMGQPPPGYPALPNYKELFGKDDLYELARAALSPPQTL